MMKWQVELSMQQHGVEHARMTEQLRADSLSNPGGKRQVANQSLRIPQRPPWAEPAHVMKTEIVVSVQPVQETRVEPEPDDVEKVSKLEELDGSANTLLWARNLMTQIAENAEELKTRESATAHEIRNAVMIQRYSEGASLEEVGKEHGVTRERVRQIINKSSWPTDRIMAARRILRDWETEQESSRITTVVNRWSQENPGETIDQAVIDLGISKSVIARALGERRTLHSAKRMRMVGRLWEDEELIDLLRQFHRETGLTTAEGFERWSRARGGPTKQTPSNRFGKWSGALAAAGIDGSYAVERERAHRDEDLWAAIVEFFMESRDGYTYRHFEEWLAEVPGRPSGALIRIRLNISWLEMSRMGQRLAAGHVDDHDPEWVADVRQPRDWSILIREEIDYVDYLGRAMADLGPVVTIAAYTQWAKENNAPSGNVLINRTGLSWKELVRSVGGRPGRRGRYLNLSDDELIAPLVTFSMSRAAVTYDEYEEWARQHDQPRPATLVKRFGDWKETVDRARQLAIASSQSTVG